MARMTCAGAVGWQLSACLMDSLLPVNALYDPNQPHPLREMGRCLPPAVVVVDRRVILHLQQKSEEGLAT
jgi:hypothetical protein